jgi:hypothetical protein
MDLISLILVFVLVVGGSIWLAHTDAHESPHLGAAIWNRLKDIYEQFKPNLKYIYGHSRNRKKGRSK